MSKPRIRLRGHHALVGIGAFLLAFTPCNGNAGASAILEDGIDRLYELSPTATVSIRNADGRIYVYGSDLPQLRVTAVRRAFSKERLEAIKVDVTINGESATLETTYPPAPDSILGDRSGTVDYIIILPETCRLSRVELGRGEVIIEGMRGPSVDVHLGTGRMTLLNCFSNVRATLGRGGLEILYDWWEARAFSLSAEVADGDLHADLPINASLHLDAATTKGQVRSFLANDDTRILDTKVGGDSAVELRLRATTGNIKIDRSY